MRQLIANLLTLLARPLDRPADLRAALEAAPLVGTLPPPQVTWCVCGLLHYRLRKCWVNADN